ncbi:MAG: hypothetical protein ACO1SX_21560 [Actinomycetota bacterium]
MDSPSNAAPRPWLLAVMAAVGLSAVGIGGWLSLRNAGLGKAPAAAPAETKTPVPTGDTASIAAPGAAIKGRKRPEQFGLPSYPSATDYHSLELGKHQGSTAFSVKHGSSAQISRFYIEKLGAAGWQYDWKRDTEVSPGDKGKRFTLKGTRVRWIQRRERKQLTLLTLDDPQKGRTAQAVLSWSPLKAPAPGKPKSD